MKWSNKQELSYNEDMKSYIFDKKGYDGVEVEVDLANKKSPFFAGDANISKEALEKEVYGLFQFNGASHD